jgi:3-deoxy-D-manno-octulosonate 8-phosphate phosphatase (KDO 8-P phosphatase)
MAIEPTTNPDPELASRLARVRLLVLDVDGTLTDGGVLYDAAGNEAKRFHIHDGLGIVLAGFVGLRVAWMTGRTSPLVERRSRELGIPANLLLQGVRDKAFALVALAARLQVPPNAVAFMGDDLNDLPALRIAGIALAPANAVPEVKAAAHLVTARAGGTGAVRDAVEAILKARGDWSYALDAYLASLASTTGSKPGQ